jgi:hypothetical protein
MGDSNTPAAEGRFGRLLRASLLVIALLHAGRGSAATIFLVTEESLDGLPCPLPLPLREGLSAALFEQGHIVFDDVDGAPGASAAALASLAQSLGAGWVLDAGVEYREQAIGSRIVRVDGHATWRLLRAPTGKDAATGAAEATNRDREGRVGRVELAAELGAAIARTVTAALGP